MRTIFASLVAAGLTSGTLAQTSSFTYQGKLLQGGEPATGVYDMTFSMYDLPTGALPIAPAVCLNDVPVEGGVFTVTLNFGQLFNTSASRYLEVAVRPDEGADCLDPDGFTALAPRTEFTSTPISMRADTAYTLRAPDGGPVPAVEVDQSGFVGVGTNVPEAKLHVMNGDLQVGKQNEAWLFHTRSHANGEFLQITDEQNGVYQFQRGLVIHENGNVGIGTTAPGAKLDIAGSLILSGSITMGATTRYLHLHGSQFQPAVGNAAGIIRDQNGVRYTGGTGGLEFFAPVHLPNGAQITEVQIAFVDNVGDTSLYLSAGLGRTNTTGGQFEFASVNSSLWYNSTAVRTWTTTSIIYPYVDNIGHSYWARVRIPGTSSGEGRLVSMRIAYVITTPLP